MYTLEHKTLPSPPIIKKMKTFLEVEGKMGPIPASQFSPHYQIPTPTLERTKPQRKEREQHPRGSGQQLPSLPLCIHPYQRPHLNPKMMYQAANPHLQLQFVRELHGLAQAKMLGNLFEDRTGCSHQTIWTMAMKIKLKINLRL